jgi:hypothetical protein
VIFAEGKYHWYGQAFQAQGMDKINEGGAATKIGVVMYESEDLLNWKYEGVILAVSEDENSELRAPMRFERPKIIYNEKTKQYVLWCHYVGYPGAHGTKPGTAEAGVAVCDKVNGKYKWLGTNRPLDGKFVRDNTLYKCEDGTAYYMFGDYKVKVAAKTGTAENAGSDHTTFICYAPYDNPEVAISVVIENGAKGRYSMQVAKDLLDAYFNNKSK